MAIFIFVHGFVPATVSYLLRPIIFSACKQLPSERTMVTYQLQQMIRNGEDFGAQPDLFILRQWSSPTKDLQI